MTTDIQDIDVPDSYGRSKRAALLYCAALIVLSFAVPIGASVLNVTVLGASVPLAIAKILTWLAAAYYTVSFFFEWRVARIINSKAMANEFGGGVNARFEELAERFQRYSERITETSEAYIAALTGVTGNIERFSDGVLAQDRDRRKEPIPAIYAKGSDDFVRETEESREEMRREFFLKLDKASADRLNFFKNTIQADIAIIERQATENGAAYGAIKDALSKLAADFNRLAGRFNTEQRFMFYVLDLGVVLLMFGCGTVSSLVAAYKILQSCNLA